MTRPTNPAATPQTALRRFAGKLALLATVGLLLVVAAFIFFGVIRAPKPKLGPRLQPIATLAHPETNEVSGLIQSRSAPNVFWIHNDSGDWPRLFAITPKAEVIVPDPLKAVGAVARAPKDGERLFPGVKVSNARLVDWEDIARHGNRLYISDMGNNLNKRQDLGIYEVIEPDPHQADTVRAERFLPVRYPDQDRFPPLDRWDFDCEAIFWWGEHLYALSKTRPAYRLYVQGHHASLYRLDSLNPDTVNVLTKVDDVDNLGGWVSAADVSFDERFLAVLIESPVQSVWLFERPTQGDQLFSQASSVRRFVFHGAGQVESLAFYHRPEAGTEENESLLILNEGGELFEVFLKDFQVVLSSRS